MKIRFISMKAGFYAVYATGRYYLYLCRRSNEELAAIVLRERNVRGWCSQRSYYLAALRRICKRRGIAYCW